MSNIRVELPTGQTVEFPAGTSTEEMNRAIEEFLAGQGGGSTPVQPPPAIPAATQQPGPTDMQMEDIPGLMDPPQRNPVVNPYAVDHEAQMQAYEDRLRERQQAMEEDRLRELNERAQGNPTTPFRRDVFYPPNPGLNLGLDYTIAGISDVWDMIVPGQREPNQFQQRRNQNQAEYRAYLREAQELYDLLGTPMEDGVGGLLGTRTATMVVPDPESTDGYRRENFRLPDPRGSTFTDMLNQALLTAGGEFGDLITEGAVTRQGEFSQSIPGYQLSGGAQFGSDVMSFMIPGLFVDKIIRHTSRAIGMGSRATNAVRFGGGAATETIISSEGDSPLAANPEIISEIFQGISPERAADVAMMADALLINGAFDVLLRGISRVGGLMGNKATGAAAGFSATARQSMGERETVMRVIRFLDPEIDAFGDAQLRRNLQTFSTIIGNNARMPIVFGEIADEIPVATVNALMRGAEDYIRVTRVPNRRGMSPEQWEQYVNAEATLMVNRMIGLTETEAAAGQAIAQRQAQISDSVADVMRRGANAELPTGAADTRDAMGQATDSLMDLRRSDIANQDAIISQNTARRDQATRELSTVASDNDTIRSLLSGATPPTEFFRTGPYVDRMRRLMGEELFTAYRTAFDNVDNAYKAIPNVRLSEEGIMAFRDVLDDVVQNANQIDTSGGTARNILGRIYTAFQPQTAVDGAGNVIIETTEELFARLSDVGFQDMYRVKQQLSRVIDSQPQGPVRDRLIDLRRHITDGDSPSGQISILRNTGDSAVADAATNADQLFRETMARFSNSEPLRQFSELAGEVRAVGHTYDGVAGAARRGEPDMIAQGTNNILPQITNDPTGAYFENFALAMDTIMSRGELNDVLAGRVTAEALYNLGVALNNSDRQSAELIIASVRPHAENLERFNPGLLDTLERAAGEIRGEVAGLRSSIDAATAVIDAATAARKQAEDSILRRFIDPTSTNVEAISNPRGVLLGMMNSNNAGNEYGRLIEQINRIPDAAEREFAMQALRATTIENISERLFTTTTGAMVEPTRASQGVSMANVQRILESNGNNILDVIDTVFANSDPIREHYRTILRNLATDELPRSVRFRLYGSDTSSQLAIRDAASTGILLTLGYMNPTAAAARRLSAEFVQRAESDLAGIRKETLVNMLAYPEEFARLTEVLMRSRDPQIITETVREVTAAMGRGVRAELRTNEDDRDRVRRSVGTVYDQTRDMLQNANPFREEEDLDGQTNGAFPR